MTNPYNEQQGPDNTGGAQPSDAQQPASGQTLAMAASRPMVSSPGAYDQVNPYAAQGGYGAAPQEHPQGTMILILGIVGFFVTICAPIAWVMGSKAQKEIAASGVSYSNEGNINIGKILGMVVTILAIIGIVITIIAVIASVALSSAG